ncbi:hypothetical protein [uncultured Sphingomonas sp.]|uniref:hypothetical protein n=1 Tax=uncultured Sphingomonas sp. TaxID=158754 RepID=UPI0025FD950A|nr:hypothetical protein [uncultured Sphingomonas sp.]
MAVRKAKMGTAWASETDVMAALHKARSNREAQQRLIGSLEDKVEGRRGELARSLADLPQQQRIPTVNSALAGFRNELKRDSAERRLIHVREAGKHMATALAVKPHYTSPVQMLMRGSLGSDRRSRLMQQIAASGPAELASFAELAAATKDMELAAALCSRVADLDVDRRPFAPSELAEALVGDEFRRVSQALMEVERLAHEAAHDDTAFESNGRNPHRDINAALMRRAEEQAGGDPYSDDEED